VVNKVYRKLNKSIRQFLSYSLIGLLSTILDFIIYNTLIGYFDLSSSLAKRLSFLFGTINSFIFNKKITFRSKKKPLFEGIKYFSVWILSFFVNSLIHDTAFIYFEGYLPFIFASIVSIAINFFGAKFWVFKK
jgi:putative flippase GtrA